MTSGLEATMNKFQSWSIQPQQDLQLLGNYSWQLLFDIDNSQNTGHIRRKEEIKTSLIVNYNNLVREVQEMSNRIHYGVEAGVKLEVVSVSMNSGIESKVSSLYEKTTEQKTENRMEKTKTEEFEVGPHSKLKLYRLVFNGPGISYETDTLSSVPHSKDDVIIQATVRAIQFLKDITVVYTKDKVSKPEDSVEEVEGWNGDINAGFGGLFVWLVPVWTTNVDEGATSVEIIVQGEENTGYSDLAKGAGGEFRYIKILRNQIERTRIVNIKLYRTERSDSKPPKFGYKQYSGDINVGRKGDYLYLCWHNEVV